MSEMLLEIEPAANATNSVILLHRKDSIAIARVPLSAGQRLQIGDASVIVRQPVPAGHKVAIKAVSAGSPVQRYGEVIGSARVDIFPGDHVHEHNLVFGEEEAAVEYQPRARTLIKNTRSFQGYERGDGRVGTRNYIAVVAASNCAAHAAELIAASFSRHEFPPELDGIVAFPHGDGCGQAMGPDTDQLRRTLGGVLNHPNVAAAIILGLGCEVNQIDHYLGPGYAKPDTGLFGLTLQGSGGTRAVIQDARNRILELIQQSADIRRTEVPASKLCVGLNCGGSDSFSGITANPALGYCCDLIVQEGGTVVLAETTEIIGAQHLLLRRSRDRDVAAKLNGVIDSYRKYLRQFGGSFNDNPSPGNKEGGLTNIVEKSLGAVAKSGTTNLNDVVDYAERIESQGLVFMNTPGYDPASLAGLAAGGVNMIAFTTGRGSAIGFPSIPVVKISSNSNVARRMPDNIDVNAGVIAEGKETVEQVGTKILDAILRIASGERSRAELLGHHEFVPWRIGPVL